MIITIKEYARKHKTSWTAIYLKYKRGNIPLIIRDGHYFIEAGTPWVKKRPGRKIQPISKEGAK